jgi:hypothetical protein
MKTCIINQFRGLGDILFTIPIARKYKADGYHVIYPTIFPEIAKHFPDINIVPKDTVNINYEKNDMNKQNGTLILPLRFADGILKLSYRNCMAAKYRLLDMPVNKWRELYWDRDNVLEKKLFHDVLGLNERTKYNFINNVFLSDFSKKIDIPVKNGNKNVFMSRIKGFTLLDWGLVIEKAETIHTVSTSLIYMLEIMELKAKEVHLYKRQGIENDHSYYDYLLTKEYVLH